jgi:penicillin-binding protein 2
MDIRRVRFAAYVVLTAVLCLTARLWYLQIVLGPELRARSERNRSRTIRRQPPRGVIEDRTGAIVATNRTRVIVHVVPAVLARSASEFSLLARLLGITDEELLNTIADRKRNDLDPVAVGRDVTMDRATAIEERLNELPGVTIGPEPVRHYPDGKLFGHLLGHLGQVDDRDERDKAALGYQRGDICGKLGVEGSSLDGALRGVDGATVVEVDATGRAHRVLSSHAPVPGATVRLTVDRDVQRAAYEGLAAWAQKGKPGAAVALDPNDGSVIALASVPGYDPNDFVLGISTKTWNGLQEDERNPLINRAVAGASAPGSTFKPITSSAGLETGLMNPYERVFCSGVIYLGRWAKRCHKHAGHGSVDLTAAMAESCDVYFYRMGQRMGPEPIARYAVKYGLGSRTGVDLPRVEQAGLVPTIAWKEKSPRRGPWVGGDTVDYAIGQSFLAVTPIQMASMTAALANGGTLYRPRLAESITTYEVNGQVTTRKQPVTVNGKVGVSQATLDRVVAGMHAAASPGGTAYRCSLPGIEMAAKTGTAQKRRRGKMINNAWFIAFAPLENPKIAVCVTVDEGGHGGAVAGPIARAMIAAYLKIKPTAPARVDAGD